MTKAFEPPARPERVLIVKPSALGDVVTAMPVLRGLRKTFGAIRVDWLVSRGCAALIEHDRELDEIVLFERNKLGTAWRSPSGTSAMWTLVRRLRAGRYDWVLDLQGLLRSGLLTRVGGASVRAGFAEAREGAAWFYTHRVSASLDMHTVDRNVALARAMGIDADGKDMTLQVTNEARAFAEGFRREHGLNGAFLVCVPPTRWITKRYPLRRWRRVCEALAREMPVVLLGTKSDRACCEAIADGPHAGIINAAGRTGVAEFVAMIATSAGVVCCDSAAKFIAPAVGVDVVTLIGPTRIERTGPYLRGRAVVADVPCQGCLRKRCPHITCMETIDPNEVSRAALDMLSPGTP